MKLQASPHLFIAGMVILGALVPPFAKGGGNEGTECTHLPGASPLMATRVALKPMIPILSLIEERTLDREVKPILPGLAALEVEVSSPSDGEKKYNCLGSGMEKGIYYSPGDRFGWINTSKQTKDRELAAQTRLRGIAGMNDFVPASRLDPIPKLDQLENRPKCSRALKEDGYWTEFIQSVDGRSYKPKQIAFGKELIRPIKTLITGLNCEQAMKAKLGFEKIKAKLPEISNVVGELTFMLNRDGTPRLIDCAPGEDGMVGGADLAESSRPGLDLLITALTTQQTLKCR